MVGTHRYGDAGTVVTAREKAVAALFVVAIVLLLAGRSVTAPDESPATVGHANPATSAPNRDIPSSNGWGEDGTVRPPAAMPAPH